MNIHHLKRSLIGCVLLIAALSPAGEPQKYNVILLFADDISAREFPAYESTVWTSPAAFGVNTKETRFRAKTPALDQLSERGAYVETCWANAVCSPSRATMMTGRYAHLHKWWQNTDIGKYKDKKGELGAWPLYLSSPHTFAHIAKQGGYNTYWTGKTQMKNSDLTKFGFDVVIDSPYNTKKTITDFVHFKDGKRWISKDTGLPSEKMIVWPETSFLWQPSIGTINYLKTKGIQQWPHTEKAKSEYGLHTFGPDVEMKFNLEFIERSHKEGKPFFIYHTSHLGHTANNYLKQKSLKGNDKVWYPGTPKISWDGSKYTRTQPKITGDKGVYDTHGTVTDPGIHHHIEYLDYQVWQYQEMLKKLGIQEKTIFIFTADNGTVGYGKMNIEKQRGPHVPFYIYIPGMTKHGKQNILMDISDILPTIADVAGVELPKEYEINGKSLLPYFSGKDQTHRDWIYTFLFERQMIRGSNVMRDGKNVWWDVSETPADLDSFPIINDWNKVSKSHREERDKLMGILPRFDKHDSEHDAPGIILPKESFKRFGKKIKR